MAVPTQALTVTYKGVYTAHGKTFPEDPLEQLRLAICAVFDSWQSERALKYMEVQQITGLLGTAVNVQVIRLSPLSLIRGRSLFFISLSTISLFLISFVYLSFLPLFLSLCPA